MTVQKEVRDMIMDECELQGKDIRISLTGENEILIYTTEDKEYRNIIIDESGDIEYLVIPKDRAGTWNKLYTYPFDNSLITNIVSKL